MNRVLAGLKAKIDLPRLKRVEELEKEGLFGKGNPWEHGRYPGEYMQLVGAYAYYPWFYEEHTTADYNPGSFGLSWDVYRQMSGSNGEFVIDGNMVSVEYAERLKTVHVPTLVIAGEDDSVTLGILKEIHAAIPASQLVVCQKPNTSHSLTKHSFLTMQ